jgi:hypothetical protein
MKQYITPSIEDLRLECVLMQAWKKTSAYLRSHSWNADTLGLHYQSLRIPHFIPEIHGHEKPGKGKAYTSSRCGDPAHDQRNLISIFEKVGLAVVPRALLRILTA